MKKKIVLRSILGFPLGLAMGYFITIIISLIFANGYYSPCVPELIVIMGSEINAVLYGTWMIGVLSSRQASTFWLFQCLKDVLKMSKTEVPPKV